MHFGQEFTPEITEEFRRKLARPIEERTAQGIGLARGEALERGLTGDPFEASAVGAARQGGAQSLANLEADLAYGQAGLQREERLLGEGRRYQTGEREASQLFGTGEGEKNRAFQERMARLGYDFEQGMRDKENKFSWGRAAETGLGLGAGALISKI